MSEIMNLSSLAAQQVSSTSALDKADSLKKKLQQVKQKNEKFNAQLEKAATELEALHIVNLLKELRSTDNNQDDLFGGSLAQDFYKGMLDEEYSNIMAASGGLGLAKMIVEQHRRK